MATATKKKSTSKSSSAKKKPVSKSKSKSTSKKPATKKPAAKKAANTNSSSTKKYPPKTNYHPTAAEGDRMKGPSAAMKEAKKEETKAPAGERKIASGEDRFTLKSIEGKKIKVLAEKNPKRESSSSHKMFELYRNGMLATTFIEKGGRLGDLKYDVKKGYISLED